MSQPATKKIKSKTVLLTSFFVDVSDVVISIVLAVASGSVVMLSEGLQGLADLLTSGLLLIGHRQSRRRANRQHRFGYGREVYFWTLMSGVGMFLITAVTSFFLGAQRFLYPEPIRYIGFTLLALLIGLITNSYAFSLSWRRLRAVHPGQSIVKTFIYSDLIEIKAAFMLDLMGTAAAFLGLVSIGVYSLTGNARFDGLGAMMVGVITAILSIFLMLEVKDLLIGKSASEDIEEKIRHAAKAVGDVKDVLDLRTMYIGSERLLVNMEVHVADDNTTDSIETIIDTIKRKVKQSVPAVKHIQVELETP
jgi:cation diffusion facilitator family transporter